MTLGFVWLIRNSGCNSGHAVRKTSVKEVYEVVITLIDVVSSINTTLIYSTKSKHVFYSNIGIGICKRISPALDLAGYGARRTSRQHQRRGYPHLGAH